MHTNPSGGILQFSHYALTPQYQQEQRLADLCVDQSQCLVHIPLYLLEMEGVSHGVSC